MNIIQIIQIINKYSQRFLPKKLADLIEKHLNPEIIRYLFSGGLSALVFILSCDLMYYVIPQTMIATGLGWIITIVFGYFMHMKVTFQVAAKHKTYVPRFILLTIINFVFNLSSAWLLHDVIGLGYEISVFVISVIWPLLSYFIMKFFVFKNTDE